MNKLTYFLQAGPFQYRQERAVKKGTPKNEEYERP